MQVDEPGKFCIHPLEQDIELMFVAVSVPLWQE